MHSRSRTLLLALLVVACDDVTAPVPAPPLTFADLVGMWDFKEWRYVSTVDSTRVEHFAPSPVPGYSFFTEIGDAGHFGFSLPARVCDPAAGCPEPADTLHLQEQMWLWAEVCPNGDPSSPDCHRARDTVVVLLPRVGTTVAAVYWLALRGDTLTVTGLPGWTDPGPCWEFVPGVCEPYVERHLLIRR
jgi:hypothetical protein